MTATVPRQPSADDIEYVCDLVRAGVAGSWHYRWPELEAVAARLGLKPEDAVWRAHDGNWSPNRKPATTAADFIREATTR